MEAIFSAIVREPLFFYGVVTCVSITSTALGTGGVIFIPLAALFFGPKEGVAIASLYFLFQNASKIAFFRDHIDWNTAIRTTAWAMPGVLIGAALLVYIPANVFQKILGIGMLVFIASDFLKHAGFMIYRINQSRAVPLWGVLYGLFSGALGSGGLIKGPFFMSMGLFKESYIGTYAASSLLMNVSKIGIYAFSGIISTPLLLSSTPFLLISLFGTWLGKKILGCISNEAFYRIIMVLFFVSALLLIF